MTHAASCGPDRGPDPARRVGHGGTSLHGRHSRDVRESHLMPPAQREVDFSPGPAPVHKSTGLIQPPGGGAQTGAGHSSRRRVWAGAGGGGGEMALGGGGDAGVAAGRRKGGEAREVKRKKSASRATLLHAFICRISYRIPRFPEK